MVLRAINSACVLAACAVSAIAILMHLKNYRKPMDQRLIVRILFMVPLFSVSAYLALYSPSALLAGGLTYFRELYEAFVIYTFYSLLTNLLGGEREIIFSTTGRPPIRFLGRFRIDISDPPTFLLVKRLVMQFVWMRPLIAVCLALSANRVAYVVLTVIYNVSITLALNALVVFWACLKDDLAPYRVVLKFLSVKLIVFFSYWQSLALTVLQALGIFAPATVHVISNTLMCIETLGFAYVHWEAFPASDYNATVLFGFARLRVGAAFRDAVGIKDLVHDFRVTFLDSRYGHRDFDSVEAVLDHPDSQTRQKRLMAGLRYKNGGRSKYWLPKPTLQKLLARTINRHGLSHYGSTSRDHADPPNGLDPPPDDVADTEQASSIHPDLAEPDAAAPDAELGYRSRDGLDHDDLHDEESDGEELLYTKARQIYGDYNYPVVTVRPSEEYVSFQDRLRRQEILESV